MRILNCGYSDAMYMPTYQRKFFLNEYLYEQEKVDEYSEQQQNMVDSGSGKRTRRVQGEELIQKMKNGDIPDQ